MSKGRQKRGQCDNCPATKRMIEVRIHGRRLRLCEACRLAYSKIVRETEAEKAKAEEAARTKIAERTPIEQYEDQLLAEDMAGIDA